MSTVRLWDNDLQLIATQENCPKPKAMNGTIEASALGDGPLSQAVTNAIPEGLLDKPLHVSVDLTDNEYEAGSPTARCTSVVLKRRGAPLRVWQHQDDHYHDHRRTMVTR